MKAMKMALLFTLAFSLLLGGCNKPDEKSKQVEAENALQTFVESHTEQDMKSLFSMISAVALPNIPNATDPYPYYGFQDTTELSSNGLYNFFLNFCDEEEVTAYWNEAENQYYIPLAFVHQTLDKYFAGYSFAPAEMTEEHGYLPEKECFVTPILVGHDVRKTGVKIAGITRNADGNIQIEAKTLELDDPTKETGDTEILVLQPVDGAFLLHSYWITPAA